MSELAAKDRLEFRTATLEDVPAIVAMLADDKLGRERETTDPALAAPYVAAFHAMSGSANQRLVVVLLDGNIVGSLQLAFLAGLAHRGARRGQIESVRIATEHRNAGLGRATIAWAVAQCRDAGCKHVQLTTDKRRHDARRFYESLGFVASHEGYKLTISPP